MITNERQYKITRAQLREFEDALAAAKESGPGTGVHPRIHQAMQESLESQIDDLQGQIARYDALKATGRFLHLNVTSIIGVLPALIDARIAAGLTQKSLSERLGVAEQQVQRWEATTYAGVSVERVQAVADAIGLSVKEEITLRQVPG